MLHGNKEFDTGISCWFIRSKNSTRVFIHITLPKLVVDLMPMHDSCTEQ